MKAFEINIDHIKLLRNLNFTYDEYTEFGAPKVDPKRPYGNGDVFGDMGKILNIKPTIEEDEEFYFSENNELKMEALHKEMTTVLQIICVTADVRTGAYVCDEYGNNWKRI